MGDSSFGLPPGEGKGGRKRRGRNSITQLMTILCMEECHHRPTPPPPPPHALIITGGARSEQGGDQVHVEMEYESGMISW